MEQDTGRHRKHKCKGVKCHKTGSVKQHRVHWSEGNRNKNMK